MRSPLAPSHVAWDDGAFAVPHLLSQLHHTPCVAASLRLRSALPCRPPLRPPRTLSRTPRNTSPNDRPISVTSSQDTAALRRENRLRSSGVATSPSSSRKLTPPRQPVRSSNSWQMALKPRYVYMTSDRASPQTQNGITAESRLSQTALHGHTHPQKLATGSERNHVVAVLEHGGHRPVPLPYPLLERNLHGMPKTRSARNRCQR